MKPYSALHLSPMVPSTNIPETVHFFEKLLQFTVVRASESYVVLTKDGVMVHIMNAGAVLQEQDVYLEVDDVDFVWSSIREHVQGIRVREPFDREYGMRELHIVIPHSGSLLFIGQVIGK